MPLDGASAETRVKIRRRSGGPQRGTQVIYEALERPYIVSDGRLFRFQRFPNLSDQYVRVKWLVDVVYRVPG